MRDSVTDEVRDPSHMNQPMVSSVLVIPGVEIDPKIQRARGEKTLLQTIFSTELGRRTPYSLFFPLVPDGERAVGRGFAAERKKRWVSSEEVGKGCHEHLEIPVFLRRGGFKKSLFNLVVLMVLVVSSVEMTPPSCKSLSFSTPILGRVFFSLLALKNCFGNLSAMVFCVCPPPQDYLLLAAHAGILTICFGSLVALSLSLYIYIYICRDIAILSLRSLISRDAFSGRSAVPPTWRDTPPFALSS